MKHALTSVAVALILAAAASFTLTGAPSNPTPSELSVDVEDRNPWTNLDLNNDRKDFQFAIVSDRTGGRRLGVFSRAIEKLNLLQPELVVSVGDLIEGGTEDPGQWALEWSEFQSKVESLDMPFFYCAGNHDISNLPMSKNWQRKFGRSYYHFLYHDVLFMVLNTEEKNGAKGSYTISSDQQQWAKEVLARNRDVRWTFVILHKPTWTYTNDDPAACGWTGIEDALEGRRYTVFSGHKHQYAKFIRKGQEYYMLATTGGGSNLSGLDNGKFDHFVWVTMKDDGPVIANLLLDGVKDSNVRTLPDPMAGK